MIKTRFAPSPTGKMHMGNARTALYSYLAARSLGGEFVLRIEDTDRERSTPENVDAIYQNLRWLGLTYDGEVYIQSAAEAYHRSLIDELLASGKAYRSLATKADVETYRAVHGASAGFRGDDDGEGAIRLRVPEGTTSFTDIIRGEISFDNERLDDFVIARSDGSPIFHLAVVADDHAQAITHVVRGEDHISNTPKQLLIGKALNFASPLYAHLPLIVSSTGKKLSKRDGDVCVEDFRNRGILPEALCNYMALLGWGAGDDTFLTPDELIERFRLEDVAKNPAMFDEVKLRWLNGQWIRSLSPEDLTSRLMDFIGPRVEWDYAAAVPAAQAKIQTLTEFFPLIQGMIEPVDNPAAIAKIFKAVEDKWLLMAAANELRALSTWSPESIAAAIDPLPALWNVKPGRVFQPLRVALTGSTVSLGIHETIALIPQRVAIGRLDRFIRVDLAHLK